MHTISAKEKKFTVKSARDKKIDLFIYIGTPILFLLIWQLLGSAGQLNTSILPTPETILLAFKTQIRTGKWQTNLKISVIRVLAGFVIGSAAGIVVGILTGIFHRFERAVAVIFGLVRSIPMMGLVPLFILWCGIGEESKIVVIAIGTFWSVLLNTQQGIETVSKKYIEVAQLFEKNTRQILTSIIVPSAIPSIFTGLRLGISSAWKCVVAAEMLAATRGLGYAIQYAREISRPADMFVGLLTIGIIGLLIDIVILKLQKILIKWT